MTINEIVAGLKKHGWTTTEIGSHCGVHEATANRWGKGLNTPSLPTIEKLQRLLTMIDGFGFDKKKDGG